MNGTEFGVALRGEETLDTCSAWFRKAVLDDAAVTHSPGATS